MVTFGAKQECQRANRQNRLRDRRGNALDMGFERSVAAVHRISWRALTCPAGQLTQAHGTHIAMSGRKGPTENARADLQVQKRMLADQTEPLAGYHRRQGDRGRLRKQASP